MSAATDPSATKPLAVLGDEDEQGSRAFHRRPCGCSVLEDSTEVGGRGGGGLSSTLGGRDDAALWLRAMTKTMVYARVTGSAGPKFSRAL